MAVAAILGSRPSIAPRTDSTTLLRAVGSHVSGLLSTAGLVKTADTGQIDWTTITWTSGAQTWGYEIWRLDDTLQSTRPVFLKLSYTAAATTFALNLFMQVGTATDGAGTLSSATGIPNTLSVSTQFVFSGSGATSTGASMTTSRQTFAYGDKSGILLSLWPEAVSTGTGGFGGMFWLERSRDPDGTPNGDAVMAMWALTGSATSGTNQPSWQQLNLYPGAITTVSASTGRGPVPMWDFGFTSGIVGSTVYVPPVIPGYTPRISGPSNLLVSPWINDWPHAAEFALEHYGVSRTFQMISPSGVSMKTGLDGSINRSLAVRIA